MYLTNSKESVILTFCPLRSILLIYVKMVILSVPIGGAATRMESDFLKTDTFS